MAREIRNNYPDIDVVLITAYLQSDLNKETLGNAAEAVLLKPFKIEDLIDILERLSNKRKQAAS